MTNASRFAGLFCAALFAGCGEAPEPANGDAVPPGTTATTAAPPGSVTIVEPAEGSEVAGASVTVQLQTTGIRIALAGDTTSGTGHHHLYLDADLTPAGQPVPVIEGSIIHMGDGSTEYTFEGVEPGGHRLIAVVGNGLHVPLQPWVVDTVTFTVGGGM